MTSSGWVQIILFIALLTVLTPLVGRYLAAVYQNQPPLRLLHPVERACYRTLGVNQDAQQGWKEYAKAVLVLSFGAVLLLYIILRTQKIHPLNSQHFHALPWDVTTNTAISFVTNTDWQFYGGEASLSNFSQMAGITVQNFLSAAIGLSVAIAVIRGFANRERSSIGNFWVDLTRSILYVFLPLSILGALFLISQGIPQSLHSPLTAHLTSGGTQTLPIGPIASQEIIKNLGTNGGGFFNVNAAMPFENPTALTNFFHVLSMLLIPAGLTATFGRFVGNKRQGWMLYFTMLALFAAATGALYINETHSTAAMQTAGIEGVNYEGKELRFGASGSALFSAATTAASCGAVNTAMSSLSGFGSVIPFANMLTGEVIFGGVGSGLYSMLMMVLLAMFLAGLMVGRTPEYLGKKIGMKEIKLVMIGTLFTPTIVLITTALSVATKWGRSSLSTTGPHGFSETFYAYTSQANNNGSAFAGFTGLIQPHAPGNLDAHGVTFANLLGSAAMFTGRYIPILAALAIAGAFARKQKNDSGLGTMRSDTPIFSFLLITTIVLIALLTFVPALLLGPITEGFSNHLISS